MLPGRESRLSCGHIRTGDGASAVTYLLILTLVLAGERTEYVIDYGLTAQDCAQVVRENPQAPLFCEAEDYQKKTAPQPDTAHLLHI